MRTSIDSVAVCMRLNMPIKKESSTMPCKLAFSAGHVGYAIYLRVCFTMPMTVVTTKIAMRVMRLMIHRTTC
jgi:hypothetical protein